MSAPVEVRLEAVLDELDEALERIEGLHHQLGDLTREALPWRPHAKLITALVMLGQGCSLVGSASHAGRQARELLDQLTLI